jgi:DNA ligase (NAD+)
MSWFSSLTTEELSARLQTANWTYRNTNTVLMSDDEYDRGLEELKRRSPAHPFLKVIGSPGTGTVLLPYVMGSLNKIRAGEGGLERFLKRWASVKSFVVSEKLDGLSALLVCGAKPRLYLQGDGVKGVEVSRAARLIQGTLNRGTGSEPVIIRGELLLGRAETPEGSIGRSLVNGWMHKSLDTSRAVPEELRKVRFVAYSVYEPGGMTREAQMNWLAAAGFETPQWAVWTRKALADESKVVEALVAMREASKYPLDGIVIGTDSVPEGLGGGEDKNPSDACAFKAALDEQKANTRVVGIEWNESRQGFLIPRIQIEPVQIGGARIEWLSGHNAKIIQDNKLGPGARICIRRSGDVIPTLDTVLEACVAGALPDGQGTRWDWDETATHARLREREDAAPGLLHALQVFGIPGIGPGLVRQLVDAGLDSVVTLRDAPVAEVAAAIGGGRGPALQEALVAKLKSASGMDLLLASNKMPRGVGERKLRGLFEIEMDHWKWKPVRFGCSAPPGWTAASLSSFWGPLEEAHKWIRQVAPESERAAVPTALPPAFVPGVVEARKPPAGVEPKGGVVFTGCRDKVLEGHLVSAGYELQDAITKKTTLLVVPDGPGKESGKLKKAREMGIEILGLSECRGKWSAGH